MHAGAPCSLLRLARAESTRVTACFRGAGRPANGGAAAAALASAAEADGCTHSKSQADLLAGSNAGEEVGAGPAAEEASVVVPAGQSQAEEGKRNVQQREMNKNDSTNADHGDVGRAAGSSGLNVLGGSGGVPEKVEAERGRQLRRVQDWAPYLTQVEPRGCMAATVCPWQTPREAADLLLTLAWG